VSQGVRGTRAATRPTIFSRQHLVCPTPRLLARRVDRETGEITDTPRMVWSKYIGQQVPARCQSNSCPVCVILNAKSRAWNIYKARPSHTMRLGLVGDDLPTISKQMERLRGQIRKVYPTFEWLWCVETNPQGTGNHVHAYLHVADDTFNPKVIEHLWSADMHVQRTPPRATVIYYGYQFKNLADPEEAPKFLALNGTPSKQYIEHHSRGFFR
jgi:hypothetical protein